MKNNYRDVVTQAEIFLQIFEEIDPDVEMLDYEHMYATQGVIYVWDKQEVKQAYIHEHLDKDFDEDEDIFDFLFRNNIEWY